MNCYIVLDGGTTNTRLYLVCGKTLDTEKLLVGSDSMESKERLRGAIRKGLEDLLHRNGVCERDVHCILASGAITSELGLYVVPHIFAPAGVGELHDNMCRVSFPEITAIPFVFIPGVRVCGDDLMLSDMMRGEETELYGLMEEPESDCLYVFPGSHNKLVTVDKTGGITGIRTMLTGEMLAALAQHTVLKAAVDLSCAEICEKSLLKGYECCQQLGINAALFKVRVMKKRFELPADEVYSYFLGIVLHGDVKSILGCGAKKIVIGGQNRMQAALALLLKNKAKVPVICAEEAQVRNSVVKGAIRIYEYE